MDILSYPDIETEENSFSSLSSVMLQKWVGNKQGLFP